MRSRILIGSCLLATLALAIPLLGEQFGRVTAVGGGLVLAGVYLADVRPVRCLNAAHVSLIRAGLLAANEQLGGPVDGRDVARPSPIGTSRRAERFPARAHQ